MASFKSLVKKIHREMISSKILIHTPLKRNSRLSELYNANIFIKEEHQQAVRSFKIRGAYSKISTLSAEQLKMGIVCASAGNHAQGVAHICNQLKIRGHIFLPEKTPLQKIQRIKYFSNDSCNLHIYGNNFDECLQESLEFSKENKTTFIHPYDDHDVIRGQATIAYEIEQDLSQTPDFIIATVGGGGLIAGISKYFKNSCQIYGVEPLGCPSMKLSLESNKIIKCEPKDIFVDGATVPKVGKLPFEICQKYIDKVYTSDNGKLCQTILDLYQNDGIIAEPAGALPFTILDKLPIENKNVVCILSGGNNDISRYPEIMDKSLIFQGLKYYYIIEFSQKPGELKRFINNVLGPHDDIVRFEYIKKTNLEVGNVLIGIQVEKANHINKIDEHLKLNKFKFIKINDNNLLYSYLI